MSMYAKCGALMDAEDAFLEISEHNVVSWSAMLSAYVELGKGKKALQPYRQLKHEGVLENERTCVFELFQRRKNLLSWKEPQQNYSPLK